MSRCDPTSSGSLGKCSVALEMMRPTLRAMLLVEHRSFLLVAFVSLVAPFVSNTALAQTIRGTIKANGGAPGHSLLVALWSQNPRTLLFDQLVEEVTSDASTGNYAFFNLADANYMVQCKDTTGMYAAEVFNDANRFDDGQVITVDGGTANVPVVDFDVALGATIQGHVRGRIGTSSESEPLAGICVDMEQVVDTNNLQLYGDYVGVVTDSSGNFKVGVRPGIYTIRFQDYGTNTFWANQLFSNTTARQWATQVVLSNVGDVVTGINALLEPGRRISGTVTRPDGQPIDKVFVFYETYNEEAQQWGLATGFKTEPDGSHSATVPPGQYRVYFTEQSMLYEHEYWPNASALSNAATITISGSNVSGINAQLEHTPLAVWAFSSGLDPFTDVVNWLKQDADSDGYNNFHEFSYGTHPKNPSSGYPYTIGAVTSNSVTISANFHQNESTAYWIDYHLLDKTNLMSPVWNSTPIYPTQKPASDPPSYEKMELTVPVNAAKSGFYKTTATINQLY